MKRQSKKLNNKITKEKPVCIFSADWHLRLDNPECRTDTFIDTLIDKVEFIKDLSNEYDIPVIIAGDIGNTPIKGWSPRLLNIVIDLFNEFNNHIYVVAGQHDLPNHRLDRIGDSGIGVLSLFDRVWFLSCSTMIGHKNGDISISGFSYEQKIIESDLEYYRNIAVVHTMVVNDDKLWHSQQQYITARQLLRRYKYDVIVSGDNHQPFVHKYKNQILVNCGSLARLKSNQITHKPRVYLYYADSNIVKPIYIPIVKEFVSNEHREKETEHDKRIEEYIEIINRPYEVGLKFKDNLEEHMHVNEIEKGVKNKVWEAYENA